MRLSLIDAHISARARSHHQSVLTPQKKANYGLDLKLLGKIIFWWIITVPVALGTAAVIELIAKAV